MLDSCGIGEMPDAAAFGDKDCHTMRRISASPRFCADNLIKMGLGTIDGQDYLPAAEHPTAAVARLTETSAGKDTTIGHWEIAGVVSEAPLPTYPEGFPKELLDEFVRRTGCKGYLGNCVASGTQILNELGDSHMSTRHPIVYTSADSVFQIAAHEDIIPVQELYKMCEIARELLSGEHTVARVIARPFVKEDNQYVRRRTGHNSYRYLFKRI